MTKGRRSRRRERSTSVWHGAPPPPLPGHVPSARAEPETARARRRLIVTATGIGGAGLLGISLSTKAGSPQFYILTMGLAGAWAAGALSSGPLPLKITKDRDGTWRRCGQLGQDLAVRQRLPGQAGNGRKACARFRHGGIVPARHRATHRIMRLPSIIDARLPAQPPRHLIHGTRPR